MADVTRPNAVCPLSLNTVLGQSKRKNGVLIGGTITYDLNTLPVSMDWGAAGFIVGDLIDQPLTPSSLYRAYPDDGASQAINLFTFKRVYFLTLAITGVGSFSDTITDYGNGTLINTGGVSSPITLGYISNLAFAEESIGTSVARTIINSFGIYGAYQASYPSTQEVLRPSQVSFTIGDDWLEAWEEFTLTVAMSAASYLEIPTNSIVVPSTVTYWVTYLSGLGSFDVIADPDPEPEPEPGDGDGCDCTWLRRQAGECTHQRRTPLESSSARRQSASGVWSRRRC